MLRNLIVLLVALLAFPNGCWKMQKRAGPASVPQAGINLLLPARDVHGIGILEWQMDQLLNRLVDDHVNALAIVWPIYMDGVTGSTVSRGPETPDNEAIAAVARKAVERGFFVMLRPIIDEANIANGGREWRGTIRPASAQRWFETYTALMLDYAELADDEGVQAFGIGTELNSMERYSGSWRAMASAVREVYAGRLLYTSNQGISGSMPWDAFDYIGVDAFFALKTPHAATYEDMVKAWTIWRAGIVNKATEIGKPLIFTEVGSVSQQGAHRRSWIWNHHSPADMEDQRLYYASACAVWKDVLEGLYWWNTTLWMLDEPLKDMSFMPLGKPAEAEIAKCFEVPKP